MAELTRDLVEPMNSFLCHPLNRRSLLGQGLIAGLGAALFPATAAENLGLAPNASTGGLREKFFGCIAGVHLGSAMAAPVEGWTWERIEREHGTLQRVR